MRPQRADKSRFCFSCKIQRENPIATNPCCRGRRPSQTSLERFSLSFRGAAVSACAEGRVATTGMKWFQVQPQGKCTALLWSKTQQHHLTACLGTHQGHKHLLYGSLPSPSSGCADVWVTSPSLGCPKTVQNGARTYINKHLPQVILQHKHKETGKVSQEALQSAVAGKNQAPPSPSLSDGASDPSELPDCTSGLPQSHSSPRSTNWFPHTGSPYSSSAPGTFSKQPVLGSSRNCHMSCSLQVLKSLG